MLMHRPWLRGLDRVDLFTAALAGVGTLLVGFASVHKIGAAGLLVPLVLVLALTLLRNPLVTAVSVIGLVVLCEGSSFGILTVTSKLYGQLYRDISILDVLVALVVAAVAIDVIRDRRPVRLPRPLVLPMVILVLAMLDGAITGHANGGSTRFVLFSEDVLVYLLLLPIAIANLDISRQTISRLLVGGMALAIIKAVLGLIEVAGGYGSLIEGTTTTLSYYEPTANWLIMIALLFVFAAALARAKPPLWMLVGSPLLIACLALSYRRSFWIAVVLGLLLVLLLGSSKMGRRLLLPVAALVIASIWLLGSINFQSQSPIVKRVESLSPSRLEANVEDRYRLDERANVLGEIRQHPLTGLGMTIPWAATVRPLSIEHEEGRQYVHFALLWFWLKLGILGLLAYLGILLGAAMLAWQTWRRSREPLLRAFGLACLCGVAGLAVIETTGTFTGVDPRFTVLFGANLGLLALLVQTKSTDSSEIQPDSGGVLAPGETPRSSRIATNSAVSRDKPSPRSAVESVVSAWIAR
jgi:O-antigen ligase